MPLVTQNAHWPLSEKHFVHLQEKLDAGRPILLVRYGEISLKGKNRPQFESLLLKRLRHALSPWPQLEVQRQHGRFLVHFHELVPETEVDAIFEAVQSVFGIVSFSPAYRFPASVENLQTVALAAYRAALESPRRPATFKVHSRRSNKSFVWDSMEINRQIGAHLLRQGPPMEVDVHQPDLTLSIEVGDQISVYTEVIKGPGGLPVGSSGKAALLLSGGIDSPVAGWLAMKRGLAVDCIHFHSFPFTSERAQQKAIDLAGRLTRYFPELRLHMVRITDVQQAIQKHCPAELFITITRRMMMRIASAIAAEQKYAAIITGESLGQVASQTIESITAVEAASSLPVLRPLIAWDKEEIVSLAKKLDTYETSIQPYEDCCTVFLPPNPATRPSLRRVEQAEESLPIEELIQQVLRQVETMVP